MEIGVRIPSAGTHASTENLVTVARWAEELGYHSVWVSDHVILPAPEDVESYYPYDPENQWRAPADTPWLDPLLALAWAGSVAPSVKLGTSVLVLPLRHPILLAKRLASLDRLTGGRVLLGAGAGWMEEEFDLIGVPFAKRGSRAAEMVALMRELWRGEPVDFDGDIWRVPTGTMQPTPAQPSIPVLWGGHSTYTLQRVAKVGDGWHPTQITIEQLADGMETIRRLCAEHNRDPDSVTIVARPGKVYRVNAETVARHRELGVHHLVVDPPLTGDVLGDCHAEMQRVAEMCDLQPRVTRK